MTADSDDKTTVVAAHFKAVLKASGSMVAGVATVGTGAARFFIRQKDESEEAFVGRVSGWIKAEGAEGLRMMQPEMLPDGVPVGEVMMRMKRSLGIPRSAGEAAEYDLKNVEMAKTKPGGDRAN